MDVLSGWIYSGFILFSGKREQPDNACYYKNIYKNLVIKMKYRICGLILALLAVINLSCLDDSGDTGGKGVLNVTVNVDTFVWGYPEQSDTDFIAFNGDTTYCWLYPDVGGDGDPVDEESLSDDPIPSTEVGDKDINIYLYEELGDNSRAYAVVRKGSTTVNGGTVTISKIVAGTYYVVAFYDYCEGGNEDNILNRYDRYSIYTETDPLEGNSTVYYDHATAIEITDDTPVDITLVINRDWVIGKPKTSTSVSAGRKFLVSGEDIPDPYTAAK